MRPRTSARKLLTASSAMLLAATMPFRLSLPAYADSGVTGTGGTITVNSSGYNTYASPGGITSSTTTQSVYYNGWAIQQVIPVYYVYTPQVVVGNPDFSNEPCLAMTTSAPIQSYAEAYQLQFSAVQTWNSLSGAYPVCNYRSGGTASTTTVNPAQVVTTYWNQIIQNQLPVPNFSIPPGFALTGLTAFLTASCTTSKTFYDNTGAGTATIDATGELWVRWDSGQGWSGPYDSCGLPWPNGTISHIYETKGSATVSLKETWIASWNLAGASGTLGGLHTSPDPITLPIYSITSEIYE